MSESLDRYRQLERRLWLTRMRHATEESPEEDRILEEMDVAWGALSDIERRQLDEEGPRCWPLDSNPAAPLPAPMPRPTTSQVWSYEGFAHPGDTIQWAA